MMPCADKDEQFDRRLPQVEVVATWRGCNLRRAPSPELSSATVFIERRGTKQLDISHIQPFTSPLTLARWHSR
jgi:hypothetical protein